MTDEIPTDRQIIDKARALADTVATSDLNAATVDGEVLPDDAIDLHHREFHAAAPVLLDELAGALERALSAAKQMRRELADANTALGVLKPPPYSVDIVFDGPPGPESGRFIEVENGDGKSISWGSWFERADGYHVLRIPVYRPVSRDTTATES